MNSIDSFLKRFEHFGVELGLERIYQLLDNLGNPHLQVPIIHIAGTNGKGSVCAYLLSILKAAGYKVGRYTSPHLVDWTERICLNEQEISSSILEQLLQEVEAAILPEQPSPTQFEVITAAAWLYFAQQEVDVAVVEVGLGGRLDATNVCHQPIVTVITSISWEHWQRLGPTLSHIAGEKAGILKPRCPAIVGVLPPEAKTVVEKRITELECPVVWAEPAELLEESQEYNSLPVAICQGIEYKVPLFGDVQLINSAIAIATVRVLETQGWEVPTAAVKQGIAQTKWPGRLQWTTWQNRQLLIDGAHNAAAAQALGRYVRTLNYPSISWVMGMLSTKEHSEIFRALLKPGDRLYLVPVPDHSSADVNQLRVIARDICTKLDFCQVYSHLILALEASITDSKNLIVLCGSLYLLGHFLRINSN
ncbi:MAG: bifunctional folylpolyglutamate synthase/dihydrofolate synthase [Trichodesmium sp. St15_bin1_1]|nr:bifunctional folylpolyglutamate synthase/dihydrofolate synthase [Trichodesmium sp. St18_bin1]MDE5115171.1 bifunctional folylpolyglutamate synthase/dihydrofolate synthase [Trichodesmium sp. St15_bin1_1]MDE5122112.1 bifunctional folylpolyglutamate synthase/dihydrofolate synthase [Trichodesmium sp. St19_bin1]